MRSLRNLPLRSSTARSAIRQASCSSSGSKPNVVSRISLAIIEALRNIHKRLGGALVVDALMRSNRSEIVGHLMVVDAKDETAASFYEHLGFERLPDDRRRLIGRL